jgi:recombination protein RecT
MAKNEIQKTETGSMSARFTSMVMKEHGTEVGPVKFDEFKKRLAQHLFIKVDMALKEAEARRNSNKLPVPMTWANVNLTKLAVDAVHRIELQLDALIPNHIHPIPYFNGRSKKYDIDLRIGYAGKDYYYREMALYPPTDVRYELVHKNDELTVCKKGLNNDVESYEFKVPNPFERGPIVGGFGYIAYDDPQRNKMVLVYMEDFKQAESASGTNKFWGPYKADMMLKTITHRTARHIVLDPKKINKSFAIVEGEEYVDIDQQAMIEADRETEDLGNTGEVIDIDPVKADEPGTTEVSAEEAAEIEAEERAMAAADGGDGDPGNSTKGPDF